MAPITIRGNELDPANPGDVQLPADASKTDFVLVQLKHGMTQEIVEALRAKHASIVKRMQDNTWLVVYPPSDLRALEAIEGVEHALVYVDNFVIHNDLKEAPDDLLDGKTVAVALHEGAEATQDEVLQSIQGMDSVRVQSASGGLIYLKATPQALERIAALDSIQAIEAAPVFSEHNDSIKTVIGLDAVNKPLLASNKHLTGAGQVVAVCDSGIDDTHEAFGANKIVAKWSARKTATTPEDLSGHGTHVAATVAGLGVKNWEGAEISGIAPGANLAMVAVTGDPNKQAGSPDEWFEGIRTKVPGVCRIISNSYGANTEAAQLAYTKVDAEILDTWALKNPDYLLVFSAGNDGQKQTPTAQVGSVATAKNILTVGATYSDRPSREDASNVVALLGGNPTTVVDYSEANLKIFKTKRGTIAPFSSRGPVLTTKRTKPDIVAPGVCVLSARAKPTNNGIITNQLLWPIGSGSYPGGPKPTDKLIFVSGTSMACPAVSGCAALLREALLKWRNVANPSAPLMKALLINGADKLPNVSSNAQGFGQINLVKTLKPLGGAPGAAVPTSSGFAQGLVERSTDTISVYKTKVPPASAASKKVNFVATLVYHDIPAAETTNKMTLVVTYKGQPKIAPAADSNDNVIQVLIENVDPGQEISIQPQTKLLVVQNIPWGVAWDHFEA